ncbi:MAG: DUF479 domain-containing protein [Flavobacteriia bacterium]|nr:DUF479 domain-containing protein [Flavobacteriia bacterium]OIP47257.1 MAG: ACP phosphodiesterase [Flavobacteriaceae bacterium CG2_30_31_66]PIV96101.1 MAG: DUF479 domain-containing protein [Flavobacteriaceae bacterium CG17_big_fil_post_rev_8_21_14_2_50_31_13]PIX11916.1 MAG: DUF479 domain-containing protein [Flavobacteriaceae bacterium CG_4_8_14_3_um_filter_31_8]PIY14011.1 MAG: DUF479 domain-containing protein [Flavobacteriaceae bacterium CG_4_10_14_3_um_filter_31_253]PIZ11053.1 MAG: DUF479 d
MIGNFIADHVTGNQFGHYQEGIQQGIFLHREIDTFTDAHEIVRKSKRRLHERYRHYDGVIIDIFYDYFLARNWSKYSKTPLEIFANSVYDLLIENFKILPLKSQHFTKYMIENNLLYNYQFEDGIEMVLKGMNHRTKGKSQMDLAIEDLKLFQEDFENDFFIFFDVLRFHILKLT